MQEHPDQPLVFPLQGSSGNALPAPPSQGSQDPPSSDWQPKPATGGGSVPGFNTSSGTKWVNNKPLYENVFNYPTQSSGAPLGQGSPPQVAGGSSQGSRPSHALPQRGPVNWRAWLLQPSRPLSSDQSGSQPHGGVVSLQRNPAAAYHAPQRWSATAYVPALPLSRLIQSSSSYRRFGKTYTKAKYTPWPEGSPALQPAAPPHFKGPQRYSHCKLKRLY